MKKFFKYLTQLPDTIFIGLGTLLVMLPINPILMPLIRRDSGVFLYVGWRILHGQVPYCDIWDHKPPFIFYINAAGLALGHGSRWGVWLIESVFLLVALMISFKLIKRLFGKTPAILGSLLWLLAMGSIISGGNYTTEYPIPMLFASLWLSYESEKKGQYSWRGYLIGFLCGLAFLSKLNAIGIGLAIVLYLFLSRIWLRRFKLLMLDLLAILAGSMTVFAATALFLLIQQALSSFWDAVFVYNLVYISTTFINRVLAVAKGLMYLSGLTLAGAVGIFLLPLSWRDKDKLSPAPNPDTWPLLLIGTLDFVIELLFIAVGGNSYRHYFMTLLPALSLFSGFAFWVLFSQSELINIFKAGKKIIGGMLAVGVVLSLVAFAIALVSDLKFSDRQPADYNQVVAYIEHHTMQEDYILMWGDQPGYNFATRRRSPSRFIYQYPLYMPGYTTPTMIEQFLSDLKKNKPALIIDTQNYRTPMIDFAITSPKIEAGKAFLRTNYIYQDKIGDWVVYKYIDQ